MITFTGIKFQFETCLFIHDTVIIVAHCLVTPHWSVLTNHWPLIGQHSLTSSKGGLSPMGKLIVFRLTSSMVEDILVKGPKLFPSSSVNSTLLMWCSSSSGTRIPNTVSSPSILSTTNWPCAEIRIINGSCFRFTCCQIFPRYPLIKLASLYPVRDKYTRVH